jgi:TrmH family RNA methyltransferase
MISKNKSRFIISLHKKKAREEENLYIIEGDKLVREFLAASAPVTLLAAKPEFITGIPAVQRNSIDEIYSISYDELKQISTLKTPHNALALVKITESVPDYDEIFSGLSLGLDFIQDPGNLGTIIRAAAWFGIRNIICSTDCVDVYNPKVVQASMGALLHVKVCYAQLSDTLSKAVSAGVKVYGTMLDGKSIYECQLAEKSIILLGNESKGLSDDLIPFITDRIKIPRYGSGQEGIDSLNVSMAASVVLSEFRRRIQTGLF